MSGHAHHPDDEVLAPSRLVRPYMVTGGRSTSASDLPIETMVKSITEKDARRLADEAKSVYLFSTEPLAIAELSAHLGLPVGVTRVVVADLLESGHLQSFETANSDDVAVVTRILNALSPAGGAK